MSSIKRVKNRSWRFQAICSDGKRRQVFFGKVTSQKDALTLQSMFDRCIEARRLNVSLEPKTPAVVVGAIR